MVRRLRDQSDHRRRRHPPATQRASVLAALRSAIVRTHPYGPIGGLPEHVRFDRGRDFLSHTVTTALIALDADITVLPPYSPHLKGSIERTSTAVSSGCCSPPYPAWGAGLGLPACRVSRYSSASRMSSRERIRCNSLCMPLPPTAAAP
ncbi:DDE-type integrase/transposase/recombinase [Streptomyces sp. SID5474]|nr:DDE-type integrase/transposase/recombinase [Streptomyces sp. SID5474]